MSNKDNDQFGGLLVNTPSCPKVMVV